MPVLATAVQEQLESGTVAASESADPASQVRSYQFSFMSSEYFNHNL